MLRREICGLMGALTMIGLAGTSAPSKAEDAVLEMTVAELRADPWRYHGQRVRVRGTFDECLGDHCALCDGPARTDAAKACGGVSFSVPAALREGREFGALIARGLRYADAVIDGRFDASCLGAVRRKSPDGRAILCEKGAGIFVDSTVISVEARRPATHRVPSEGTERLLSPSGADEAGLRAAFVESLPGYVGEEGFDEADSLPYVLDLDQADAVVRLEAAGGMCVCLRAECRKDDWPVTRGQTYMTTFVDPYRCWEAERRNGKWHFLIMPYHELFAH